MSTIIPRKISASRLVFISSGLLALAHGALATQPVFEAQTQVRESILGEASRAPAFDLKSSLDPGAATHEVRGPDAQVQARRFILAESTPRSTTDSGAIALESASLQGTVRIDPQDQARQFIVAKPAVRGISGRVVLPVSNTAATSALSARNSHVVHSESP
jgi:hypothetical protein